MHLPVVDLLTSCRRLLHDTSFSLKVSFTVTHLTLANLDVCSLQVGQNFIPSSVPSTFAPSPTPAPPAVSSGLNDLFELSTSMAITTGGYVAPKAVSFTLLNTATSVSSYLHLLTAALLAGVAACGEGQGPGDLRHFLPPSGSHVHGHDLHQQGPAAHDRLCDSVQQEQVSPTSAF